MARARGRAGDADVSGNRVVSYVRVSSKDQEREGFSIPAQSKLLSEYADKLDLRIAEEFADVETAKRSGRANFTAMVQYLKRHPSVRAILVEKTDRLYRNLKDWVTIDELGVEIHFVKENVVLSGDSRSSEKFMHGIKVLVAKNYIDNLSEETRKGMLEKAQQGLWPTFAPMGYKNHLMANGKRVITVDAEMAPLVVQLFEWYSTGLYSLKEVAAKARAIGLVYRKSRNRIGVSTIHQMLKHRIYTGKFEWLGKVYQGSHVPLISEETWTQVQEVLECRGSAKLRGSKVHDFTFTGMIKCRHCGCALVGDIKKEKYVYYRCSGNKGRCGEPYVREKLLEQQCAAILDRMRFDEETLGLMMKALKESFAVETKDHADALARVRTEQDRLNKRLELLWVDKADGKIDLAFYDTMSKQWQTELARCARDAESLNKASWSYMDEGIALLALAREASSIFSNKHGAHKRLLLNLACSNLTWASGELHAEFKQPFDLLVKTFATAESAQSAGSGKNRGKANWLPELDSNQRPFD